MKTTAATAAATKPLRAARLEVVGAGNQEPGEDNSGPALYTRLQARLKEEPALRAYLHELVSGWGCVEPAGGIEQFSKL